jgi:uncharacterized protein YjbJ (UPF0337 family)
MLNTKTKSSGRNKAEGTVDRIAGRVLEAWGALTGSNKARAKGAAARGRGGFRTTTGNAKRTARR